MRFSIALTTLAGLLSMGCTCGESGSQQARAARALDPCTIRFNEYEAARTATPCQTDADCVFAPGILRPHTREGRMGGEPLVCGSATVASTLPQLETLIEAWRAASCGPVGEPGSSACSAFSHGARVACTNAICTAVY